MKGKLLSDITKEAYSKAFDSEADGFVLGYEMATKVIKMVVGLYNGKYVCEEVSVYDSDGNDLSDRFQDLVKLVANECTPDRDVVIDELDRYRTERYKFNFEF